jgi:hypothetical protein
MSKPAKRKLSKKDAYFLNRLELTPEVKEALLDEWPVLESLLNQKLTLEEAYGIAFDQDDAD